ncbi:hypothetical protein [Paenibacillus sp. JJ-223]|uniref:hypothetical protein n=1 Tax=Paenibacillus sp. JJ-223 TaxID=2905647 RepID=UPI001F32BCA5|nr:hypothetical protein [Paenibacillus sp. JJ-223]CAH1195752.1 hypothetical protein PAECIP111890_00808 [Paenibacillus sp. JJ-223]
MGWELSNCKVAQSGDGVSDKVGDEAIREAICEVANLSFGANGANHKGIPGVITMTGNALLFVI